MSNQKDAKLSQMEGGLISRFAIKIENQKLAVEEIAKWLKKNSN